MGTAPPIYTLSGQFYFSLLSVVLRALCVYLTSRHHPHPTGYPCAKFCFCRAPIAELACREKLRIQSITHSLTHPASLICREPK